MQDSPPPFPWSAKKCSIQFNPITLLNRRPSSLIVYRYIDCIPVHRISCHFNIIIIIRRMIMGFIRRIKLICSIVTIHMVFVFLFWLPLALLWIQRALWIHYLFWQGFCSPSMFMEGFASRSLKVQRLPSWIWWSWEASLPAIMRGKRLNLGTWFPKHFAFGGKSLQFWWEIYHDFSLFLTIMCKKSTFLTPFLTTFQENIAFFQPCQLYGGNLWFCVSYQSILNLCPCGLPNLWKETSPVRSLVYCIVYYVRFAINLPNPLSKKNRLTPLISL